MEEEGQEPTRNNSLGKKKGANKFAQYGFIPQLFLNIMVNKLKAPTPVQRQAIPLIMEGKDLIACYKTGSGKTLAYVLPIVDKLKTHSQIVGARALILIPTRDLADQISKVLRTYLHKTDLRYSLILGGHTYEGQFESLATNPDIIVATPGRLMQLLVETDLKLTRLQTIVFDEADQLFGEKQFENELREIVSRCPISQRLMFSATITDELNEFAKSTLRQYSYIHEEIALPEQMLIDFMVVRPDEKKSALLLTLDRITTGKTIIFTSTRYHVEFLLALLRNTYKCFGVYGKLDMDLRTSALDRFRSSKGQVLLIVTDVAARGLDIPAVQYVVHYDYPSNHQIFIHRSGRTARNQQAGHTLALLTPAELPYLVELSGLVGRKLTLDKGLKESISYGTVPLAALEPYISQFDQLKDRNDDLIKYEEVSEKAYQKFKKSCTPASVQSLRRSRSMPMDTHPYFSGDMSEDEKEFMAKVHNYTPKHAFLELQRLDNDKVPNEDRFLTAVNKIRKEQQSCEETRKKKERLRAANSFQWQELLDKNEIKEFEEYRDTVNQHKLPIDPVEGVEIQYEAPSRKAIRMDFKNLNQYISPVKDHNVRTEFDDLPRIKTSDIDVVLADQGPKKRENKAKRVWDASKKNYVWKQDEEDKLSKAEKGKKAYHKWKKSTKLSIPKAGYAENTEQTNAAKDSWLKRRKFRHGWREDKEKGVQPRKDNKTKAIKKRFKERLVNKAGARGKGMSRGRGASRGSSRGGKGQR